MQLLGRLMDRALKARGQRATIVGATSGDTGAAAIEAFRGLDQVDVFILYPHGRVSDVQRRQMTTVEADNIHAIALEGTFDDAQAMLKGFFRNKPTSRRAGAVRRQFDQFRPRRRRRWSIISPPPPCSAARGEKSPSPCRPAISATFSPATWPGRWGCRSKSSSSPPIPTISSPARWKPGAMKCAASTRRNRRRWISRSPPISSGCCSTRWAAIPRPSARLMASLDQSGAFDIPAPALAEDPREFAAGAASEAETRPKSPAPGANANICSIRIPPSRVHVARKTSGAATRDPDGGARHRPSREIPGRRAQGDRRLRAPAGASCRPVRRARSVSTSCQRRPGGR